MSYYRKLFHKRFTVGLFLTAVGTALLLSSILMKWELLGEGQYARLRKVRIEHVERESCTYILEQSFLLRNPSSKTVVDLVYVWIPVNESRQFTRLLNSTLRPLFMKSDDEVAILVYNVSLTEGGTMWLNVTLQVTVEGYRFLMENIPWLNRSQVEENTGGKGYWAVENQTYISVAKSIGLNARDPVEACRIVGEWIRKRLQYYEGPRKGANHALIEMGGELFVRGDCEEAADVFVTLTRILGIRSRVVHGLRLLGYREGSVTMWIKRTERGYEYSENWGGHAWSQIYLPQAGWVDFELGAYEVRIGDLTPYYVRYGFEEKSYLASYVSYCLTRHMETDLLYFTFRWVQP